MGRKQKLIYALSGFVLGVLLTCGIWLCVGGSHSGVVSTPEDEPLGASTVPGGKTDETAAHTNAVLNAVDFINVMAYDGGDHTSYNGMEVYYNGMGTIEEKTLYAKENLGGVMIWELMQDTSNPDKSLLQTIGRVIK